MRVLKAHADFFKQKTRAVGALVRLKPLGHPSADARF